MSRAVVLYLGHAQRFPNVSSRPVLDHFGDEGPSMVDRARELVAEADAINIDWSEHDLASAGQQVREIMARRHPELTDEALRALSWKWTFDQR